MNDTPKTPKTSGAQTPGPKAIVYVREADPQILPDRLRDSGAKVYALHDMAGNPVAIAPDRAQAFALALRNDLLPMSVH